MPQDERGRADEDLGRSLDEQAVPEWRFSMMTGTLVALGVVTLMIFAGVIWYAYNAGLKMASDAPVIVEAEQGETKVRPDDPGGESFAHQDKTVYDKIDGSGEAAEQLLPGAEEPIEKPQIISPDTEDLPPAGQPKIVRIPQTSDSVPPPPTVVAPEIADPMAGAVRESNENSTTAELPALEYNVAPPVTEAPPMIPQKAPVDDQSGAPAEPPEEMMRGDAAAPPATVSKPGAGAFLLQLGAFRSQEAAVAGWKLFNSSHEKILGPVDNFITEADLGEKGRFYRLQVGPYPDRAAAAVTCAALKDAGANCLIVTR